MQQNLQYHADEIDQHSRHRGLSADVAHFLITGCDDGPAPTDREVPRGLPYGVTRDLPAGVAGVWVADALTSRESSRVTVTLGTAGRDVGGSVHFGPPAFDVTLPLAGSMASPTRLQATIGTGDGLVTFAATYDAELGTLEGPVLYAGRVLYSLRLVRR